MTDTDAILRDWYKFWAGEIEFPWVEPRTAEIIPFPKRRKRS
jgi:hypothetical protein